MSIIDLDSPLYHRALAISVGHFLSVMPADKTPMQVLDALSNEPEQWPEDITPWQPFQFDTPDQVAEYIEDLAHSIYAAFVTDAFAIPALTEEAA